MDYMEWVDAYIAGELPEAQRTEFEGALAGSSELRQEVEFARKLHRAMTMGMPDPLAESMANQAAEAHHLARKNMFQRYRSGNLKRVERRQFEEKLAEDVLFAFEWVEFKRNHPMPAKQLQLVHLYRAAAALILLGFFSWWMFQYAGRRGERLYARHDATELFPQVEYALVNEGLHHLGIMGSHDFDSLKIAGLKAFEGKNWDEAIRLLDDYTRKAKPSEEETPDEINLINLYIGRAWLEKKDPVKSIEFLRKAIYGVVDQANYCLLQELMRWHLALAYLRNNDIPAARATLLPLQNAQHETIRQQAVNLLNDLK